MESLRIVTLCILSAVFYGILHDQVTARICVEYFTIGHPPVFGTADPTILGIGWGIIATWWVGLILGVPLAIAAQVGNRPKRSAASLIRPIGSLLLIMGACAFLAGCLGSLLARNQAIFLIGPMAELVPDQHHVAFLTDLWAHNASYLSGFLGGVVLIWQTFRSRNVTKPLCP